MVEQLDPDDRLGRRRLAARAMARAARDQGPPASGRGARGERRGADAVVVSNHGGRQLDGAVASIAALPGIVDAVGDSMPVLVDGGFRRGIDVIKALALGARGVLIGRPHLWGVACAGEEGVYWVLELFRREIDRAMALGGWDGVAKINREILFR